MPTIIVGEAWQPECEAADHIASTISKQKEMNAQVPFSFYSDLKPSPRDGATYNSSWFSLLRLNLSGNTLTDTTRVWLLGDSTSAQLTLKMNHHTKV